MAEQSAETSGSSSTQNVLHIVGNVTEAVYSFLGPASETLDRAGFAQTIVMLDNPRHRHLKVKFAPGIRLETEARNRRHWLLMEKVIRGLLDTQQYSAVHLHGFLPWALGTRMGRLLPREVKVYYSPHGSRTLKLLRPLQSTMASVMSLLGPAQPDIIASSVSDARRISSITDGPVMTVEAAIDDEFFEHPRNEARRPLLVSGDTDENQRSVELFCRLAVVMSAAELGLSFNWIGHPDEISNARLKAANVGPFEINDRQAIAARLSTGWIFMAAGDADEFPVLLGWAMALGLPCVVANTAYHRDLITHGQNGLIYNSEEEALAQVSRLIDNPALRAQLGEAARADARERLSRSKLDDALLAAYRRPAEAAAEKAAGPVSLAPAGEGQANPSA